MTQTHIDLYAAPHPFAVERLHAKIPAGATLAEIASRAQPDPLLARHAHLYVDGDYVPRDAWARIKPKPGATVTLRMVPMGGGGGKNPLRTVLSLAIMAAMPALSASLTGALGSGIGGSVFGISSSRLLSSGINLLGRLALNAIAPPARARQAAPKESPTLFIQGARNQAYPFGRVPKVLGRHRFVPPLGALPYTETAGNDQYLRMLFVWGYGPLRISELKIGETPVTDFSDIEIETRQGYDDDAPLTLYTDSVLQNDLGVTLTNAGGAVTRTSEADADEVSIDITLPRGLFLFSKTGAKTNASVRIEAQYAPAGTGDWSAPSDGYKSILSRTSDIFVKPAVFTRAGVGYETRRIDILAMDRAGGYLKILAGAVWVNGIDAGTGASLPAVPADVTALAAIERRSGDADAIISGRITDMRDTTFFQTGADFAVTASLTAGKVEIAAGGLQFPGFVITAKQSAALRQSLTFKVPKGQYDVRLRRITADAADDSLFDETAWTALRTLRYAYPVRMTGVAMTAVRIRATDQLSGIIDRFNGVVESILPDWNGAEWTDQPTSNPAAIFRHILQGRGNARPLPDSRLDLTRIEEWHDACHAAGREFNNIVDYDVSVREILNDAAAAGRVSPCLLDGKWAVVEDKPQTVPVQHFTPRNTYGFQGAKAFDEVPEALRIRFINRAKGWLQDERLVYDDAVTAETADKYDTLDLTGVTDAAQAWKDGRYHIATARLRPETFSFYCDIEHIVCTRGDLVRFTHDVPLFGLASARVASTVTSGGNVTGVMLDDAVTMEAGKSYGLRCRKSDGGSVVVPIVPAAGITALLNFAAPLPISAAPQPGDLALFGESGAESVELIVTAIEPQGNLSAKITCAAAAPQVHLADTGTIPAFSSNITLPPEMKRPPAPVLSRIQSGAESLIVGSDGSLTTRIQITLAPPAYARALDMQVMIRGDGESLFRKAETLATSPTSVSVIDVNEGEIYDITLRYVSESGALSDLLTIAGHRVTGASDLPADVGNFRINVLGASVYLAWDRVTDIDLSHYILRFSPALSGVDWSSAVDLLPHISGDATSVAVPAAIGTYLLKAADLGGRQSQNATLVVTTIAALSGYNAVMTVAESPGFAGTRDGVALTASGLMLDGADDMNDWPDMDAMDNIDAGLLGLVDQGSYAFAGVADLGAVYTSRLAAQMTVGGISMNASVDTFGLIDAEENFDQSIDPSLWSLKLQLSTTNDDPAGAPGWSGWQDFVIGDYTARAYRFRLLFGADAANVSPLVTALSVTIDMPDRTAGGNGILSDPAGSNILYDRPFRAAPVVAVSAESMSTGDYYAITARSETGFTIRFFDAAGSGIARTFDYIAKGYGDAS